MAAETGFLIDGTVYEVPELASFNLAERHVMYGLCDFLPEDFLQQEDESDEDHVAREAKMGRHPGFWQTLMEVAYQRGNPTLKPGKVRLIVEATNYYDAVETLSTEDDEDEDGGDDAGPLALTKPPDDPSPSEPPSLASSSEPRPEPGGTDSTNDSAPPADPPTPTGTLRSVISSPESPPAESAA